MNRIRTGLLAGSLVLWAAGTATDPSGGLWLQTVSVPWPVLVGLGIFPPERLTEIIEARFNPKREEGNG